MLLRTRQDVPCSSQARRRFRWSEVIVADAVDVSENDKGWPRSRYSMCSHQMGSVAACDPASIELFCRSRHFLPQSQYMLTTTYIPVDHLSCLDKYASMCAVQDFCREQVSRLACCCMLHMLVSCEIVLFGAFHDASMHLYEMSRVVGTSHGPHRSSLP